MWTKVHFSFAVRQPASNVEGFLKQELDFNSTVAAAKKSATNTVACKRGQQTLLSNGDVTESPVPTVRVSGFFSFSLNSFKVQIHQGHMSVVAPNSSNAQNGIARTACKLRSRFCSRHFPNMK